MNPRRLLTALMAVLLLVAPTLQADPDVCGNIDGDAGGALTISDYTYAVDWLWGNGPAPPNFEVADWDYYELLTIRDLYWLLWSDFPPTCPPGELPLHIQSVVWDSLYLHTFQSYVPPFSSLTNGLFNIDVYISTDTAIEFSEHSFSLSVGGTTASIVGLEYTTECQRPLECVKFKKVDTASGIVNLAQWDHTGWAGGALWPGRTKVATLTIAVSPSQTTWEPIAIALDSMGPAQEGYLVHQNWSIPLFGWNIWEGQVAHFPCIGLRGNVNGDPLDEVDISDLTYLVSYMFNPPPSIPLIGDEYVDPPLIFEEVDMDANLSIDIADLTRLVGYMFRGGPAPEMCPN